MSLFDLFNRLAEMEKLAPTQGTAKPHQLGNETNRNVDGASSVPPFDAIVLEQIHKRSTLRPIVTKCEPNDYLVLREHFRQYLPYILAELRASADEKVASLESGRKPRRSPVLMKQERQVKSGGQFVSFELEISSKDMPKLDHGFYNELVLLMPPDQGSERAFYFAVARLARGQRDDVDEVDSDDESDSGVPKAARPLQLRMSMRQEDYNDLSRLGGKVIRLEMCHIQGLIPAERQYNACRDPPLDAHATRQIAAGTLPPWTVASAIDASAPHLSELNESQRRCVERLATPAKSRILDLYDDDDDYDDDDYDDDDYYGWPTSNDRLQSGLFLLQGPPGTGKTTTTAALIVELALRYRRDSLLICAPSNQALRELLIRVSELLTAYPPHERPSMALVGVAKKLPPTLDGVYAHKFASRLWKPLIALKRELRALSRRAYRREDEQRITNAIHEHCRAVVLPRLNGLVVGRNAFHVRRHLRTAVRKMCADARSLVSDVMAATEGDRLVIAMEALIVLLQSGAKTCEQFLVQRAQIVFATLVGSGRPWLRRQRSAFEVVVVDEAGQALVPEVAIPMHFRPRLMVQVGDPQQLAPVVQAVDATHTFAQSMMHVLMFDHGQPFERLHVQYRMHPSICAWVSDTFYDGALVTHASVSARPSLRIQFRFLDPRLDTPSLFIDVSRGAEVRGDGRSWRNEEEAQLVVDTLFYLLRHCQVPPGQIGVISFYASQVTLIKALLTTRLQHERRGGRITHEQHCEWARVLVHTVDGFQGGERTITLVSCVRSSSAVGFLSNARRLNVAMSRAQSARWVFGHATGLRAAFDSVLPSFLATHRCSTLPAETLATIATGGTAKANGGTAKASGGTAKASGGTAKASDGTAKASGGATRILRRGA